MNASEEYASVEGQARTHEAKGRWMDENGVTKAAKTN